MFANPRLLLLLVAAGLLPAETVRFKERCLHDLVAQVPAILASQDRATGRFGQGIWIVTDQNVMLPLAAAWSRKDPANPYYHSREVLDAIMSAGDALIADADSTGQWEFRKKDGSTWGKIYMPWTYSRWIRSFALVRDAMPEARRAKWEKALRLGYTGIAKQVAAARVQNIPCHHAMGLYIASQVFEEPAWRTEAVEYLHKAAAAQHRDGYWSEHLGPVVSYGFVYVDALGVYYAVSKDRSILPVLRKSAVFHSHFTYPDGTDVETIDERNPYHASERLPNVGFTFTPEGRSYLARQLRLRTSPVPADDAASLLLWGEEGEGAGDLTKSDFDFVLGSGDAAVRRRGPWFFAASTMTCPVFDSRWIQDRQNFVSVFHDKVGLILGGGNTKLQPGWSNFTVGDTSLLTRRPGDENPNFQPPPGLLHVPTAARLLGKDAFGVALDYGKARGTVRLDIAGPNRLEYSITGDPSMVAHVTVLPRMGQTIASASGRSAAFSAEPFTWKDGAAGEWIEFSGVRLTLPPRATVRWPVLPHNPYTKDGHAAPEEGRLVVDVPMRAPCKLAVEIR